MIKEDESSVENESKQIEIAISADEKAGSDLDIDLSESHASQFDEEFQLDIESDKSEIDFVVDTTEDSEVHKTSEVKLSIRQESEDADVAIGFEEENVENFQKINIEGKFISIKCDKIDISTVFAFLHGKREK